MRREKGKAGSYYGSLSSWQGMTIPNDRDEQRPCAGKGETIVPQRVRTVITRMGHSSGHSHRTVDHPGGPEFILKFVLNYWSHLTTLKKYDGGPSIN